MGAVSDGRFKTSKTKNRCLFLFVKVMSVERGKAPKDQSRMRADDSTREEKRLAELMIPKKHKRLYDKIMFGKKRKAREVRN